MTFARQLVATLAMLASALAPGGASGQQPAAHPNPAGPDGAQPSIPDIPSGPATIRGRVVHDEQPSAAGGVPVILYALSPDGVPGLRGMVADASGSFSFEGVNNDPNTVYLLGARYREVPFDVRFSFQAGELERDLELKISDPVADATGAAVADALIQIEKSCGGLSIRESHLLENSGDRVIYIPESERDGREPLLRVVLPEGAEELQFSVGDDLEWDGDTLSFWGPLDPGGQDLEFSYGIPERGSSFDVRRTFPSGAKRVRFVSHSSGTTLTSAASTNAELRSGESVDLNGERFETLESKNVAPGDTLAVRVELTSGHKPPVGLSAVETRIWLEIDGAAVTVDQQHSLEVKNDGPLVSASGAPLLCISIPEGAESLRFSSSTLALGLGRDPSGAIAIRGPMPTGKIEVALRYRLRSNGGKPTFVHSMPLDVPLVSVLIADTGLIVETDQLHRRRPMRTSDRNYLHLEGFEFSAGELLELKLRPIETRAPLPKFAATGLAAVSTALLIGFLIAPLRRPTEETPALNRAASGAAEERDAVLESIRSLDEDFEMGKLTETDHREMRLALRAEAVNLLRLEREAVSERRAEATDPRLCSGCGADVASGSRFCAQCGTSLVERNTAGGDDAA